MPIKRIEMALHVQQLCAENNITVLYQSLDDDVPRYYAKPTSRLICIRPTKNTGYYVSALHELGHILGKRQAPNISTLTRELYAWIWARQQALLWNDTAERIMRRAMDSYRWTSREKEKWEQVSNKTPDLVTV